MPKGVVLKTSHWPIDKEEMMTPSLVFRRLCCEHSSALAAAAVDMFCKGTNT